jgi:hypothetical protein
MPMKGQPHSHGAHGEAQWMGCCRRAALSHNKAVVCSQKGGCTHMEPMVRPSGTPCIAYSVVSSTRFQNSVRTLSPCAHTL